MAGHEGSPTRGTTGTNRLRRVDRWIAHLPVFRRAHDPLVVDLGFGASGVTAFELATRLRSANPTIRVLGLEIDPDRVAVAEDQLASVRAGLTPFPRDLPVSFARGGFEVPVPRPATIIRAYNVLRQYDESDVRGAWRRMAAQLTPDGLLIEGTCDEIGRVSSWIDVAADAQPLRFSLSLSLAHVERPSIVAERLPKALIHRNVDGERIHELLTALDGAWDRSAGYATFGPIQRWLATVSALRDAGWPVQGTKSRWRLGELTLPWSAVEPRNES